MDKLYMKKKNTNKQNKNSKFVTKSAYELMFGNTSQTFPVAGKKYYKTRTSNPTLNGKTLIKNN